MALALEAVKAVEACRAKLVPAGTAKSQSVLTIRHAMRRWPRGEMQHTRARSMERRARQALQEVFVNNGAEQCALTSCIFFEIASCAWTRISVRLPNGRLRQSSARRRRRGI